MDPFIVIILSVVLLILLFSIIRGYIRVGNHKESSDSYDDSQPAIDCYWKTIEWVPVKVDLQFTYKKSKGKTTNRAVSVTGYDGSAYLKGFCKLRNSNRTFRIDRILNAVNTETGEIIENIPDYLLARYRQSPEYAISKVFKKHLDIIKVLFYVGKADGQLQVAERKIIYQTIRSIAKNKGLTDADIGKFFKKLKVPNLQKFKISFGRVCKNQPKQISQLYYTAKKIIATHKTRHTNEAEALEYMKKKMKKEKIWQQKRNQG
jgi:hypothetical protein